MSKNKVADNTGKQSKGKKVKDDASDLSGSSTRKLKSDSAHQQVNETPITVDDNDEDSESPLASRKVGRTGRCRVKDLSSSDEDLFGADALSLAKKKRKKSTKLDVALFDSDSDEDPLPRPSKERSSKRKSRKMDIADEDKPSIVDAISRMSSKHPSPKKSAKKSVEEIKKDISPADFFGLTPVHVGKHDKMKSDATSSDPVSLSLSADTRSTSSKLAAKMKSDDSAEQPKTVLKPTSESQEAASSGSSEHTAVLSTPSKSTALETSLRRHCCVNTAPTHGS